MSDQVAGTVELALADSSVARSAGCIIFWCGSWGFAALHRGFLAVVRSAD